MSENTSDDALQALRDNLVGTDTLQDVLDRDQERERAAEERRDLRDSIQWEADRYVRLVDLAVADPEVLTQMRQGRKIHAIKQLRLIGMITRDGFEIQPSLLAAKNAIEGDEVASAMKQVWVYIVGDCEGERCEPYSFEKDASDRVDEINESQGEGFAHYETRELIGFGQRPANKHHGI